GQLGLAGAIVTVSLLMVTAYFAKVTRKGAEYVYQEDLDRYYIWCCGGDVFHLVKLDRSGNIIPVGGGTGRAGTSFYGVPCQHLNVPDSRGRQEVPETELVYEFRSGYLILGTFTRVGDFIPAEASRVTRFPDSLSPPDTPRIYTPPGRFVEKPAKDGRN